MGWNCPPQGSIYLVNNYYFLGLFSLDFSFVFLIFFFPRLLFFFLGLLLISFLLPPLTPIFFGNSYLPPPTYLKPFLLPTHQPPSFCSPFLCTPLHRQCLKNMDNMDIWVEGFQSFKNLKSVKKGPISKFEGGQFEAWEKAELAKHEEPTSLEVSFLLPLFFVCCCCCCCCFFFFFFFF